MFAFIVQLLFG